MCGEPFKYAREECTKQRNRGLKTKCGGSGGRTRGEKSGETGSHSERSAGENNPLSLSLPLPPFRSSARAPAPALFIRKTSHPQSDTEVFDFLTSQPTQEYFAFSGTDSATLLSVRLAGLGVGRGNTYALIGHFHFANFVHPVGHTRPVLQMLTASQLCPVPSPPLPLEYAMACAVNVLKNSISQPPPQ